LKGSTQLIWQKDTASFQAGWTSNMDRGNSAEGEGSIHL